MTTTTNPTPEFKTAILSALVAQGLSINPVIYFDGDLHDGNEDWAFVKLGDKSFDVNYWIDDSTFHITAYPAVHNEVGHLVTDYGTFCRIITQPLARYELGYSDKSVSRALAIENASERPRIV